MKLRVSPVVTVDINIYLFQDPISHDQISELVLVYEFKTIFSYNLVYITNIHVIFSYPGNFDLCKSANIGLIDSDPSYFMATIFSLRRIKMILRVLLP